MDSFFGIGIFELFLIAVIALVVLGPERLPGAMRTIAGYIRQIREVGSEFTSQFSDEIKMLEEMDPRRMINDVLDPAKTPTPSSSAAKPAPARPSTPAKPAAPGSAAKSATAAAAVAKNAVPATGEENMILPPKTGETSTDEAGGKAAAEVATEQVIAPPAASKTATPVNGAAQPIEAGGPSATEDPVPAATPVNGTPSQAVEPTEPKAAAPAED